MRSIRIASLALAAALCLGAATAPLTVDDCVRLALERAPVVQGATADIAAAQALERSARAAYFPKLIGQAQYGVSQGYDIAVTNGGVTALGVAIEAPLYDGGLRAAQLEAARARLQSAAALAQQRRADAAFSARNAYYAALAARSEVDIQRDTIGTLTSYLDLLRRQQELGLVPASDAPRVELAVHSAQSAERAAGATLNGALRELGELTGAAVDEAMLVDPPGTPLGPVGDDLVEASPSIADARASADAARRDADAIRSEGRGRLALTADGGFLGVDPGKTFRDNGGGEFLLGFILPLFDGGALSARVAAASAATASAEAKVRQARQTLVIALARLRADALRAQADAEAWQRALPVASESFLLLRARYFGGGGVRLLDVLDGLNQSVEVRLATARARLAYRLATATQAQLLGRIEP